MLILIAHGSRDPRWRASVEAPVAFLQARLGTDRIRLAYMDCAPPTLMDVVSDAVQAGVKSIRVLPLFLASEGHVGRDICPMVDEVREAYCDLQVELLPPLGQQRLFRDLLYAIAVDEAD